MRRKFRVVSGQRFTSTQGVPVDLMARDVRSRAAASCYWHPGYVMRGWTMREWTTEASRERYRRAMVADHCDL